VPAKTTLIKENVQVIVTATVVANKDVIIVLRRKTTLNSKPTPKIKVLNSTSNWME
jgi:hypothetical protein